MSHTKTESIREGLEQVRREVDKWPSWMKTNASPETIGESLNSSNEVEQSCEGPADQNS